jgi:hypothetical protein
MNTGKMLKDLHLSWGDLVALHEIAGRSKEAFAYMGVKRTQPPWPGEYQQSSISDIVDECRGIKTLGRCYTKPSFEVKIVTS